jgi:hypothetical protein
MPNRELENLVAVGSLKAESPDAAEIAGLIRSGETRLRDAENSSLSLESRFDLAYNAAHALALAALRYNGYRPDGRYLVFQTLGHTAGMDTAKWRVLSKCHDARNLAEYEGHTDVDLKLLDELLRIATELEAAIQAKLPPKP